MTPDLLTEIGLNKTQAKLYLTLIESGALLPSELADKTEEKRTNSYMVLEQLERLGLVEKVTKNNHIVIVEPNQQLLAKGKN